MNERRSTINDGLKSTPILLFPHSLALHGFHSPPSPFRAFRAFRSCLSAFRPLPSVLRSLNPWLLRILQSIATIAVFWAFAVLFFCL
jgi:hypothetical protein